MKRLFLALALLLLAPLAYAASPSLLRVTHPMTMSAANAPAGGALLTWNASPTVNADYNLYRTTTTASAACPTSLASYGAPLVTGITALTYTDATADAGLFCYVATTTKNGAESAPSNAASVSVQPQPPTGLTAH